MARAFVLVRDVEAEGEALRFVCQVSYHGAGVEGVDSARIEAIVAGNDVPEEKMLDAVLAKAAELGYPLASNRVLVPSYERGS